MNIYEIERWLDDRYLVTHHIDVDRQVEQATCIDREGPFFNGCPCELGIIDYEDIAGLDLSPDEIYVVTGHGESITLPHYIMVDAAIDKYELCQELNALIFEKVSFNDKLAYLNQCLFSDNFMECTLNYFFSLFENPIMFVDYSHYVISHRQRAPLGIDIWDNAVAYGHYDPHLIDDTFQDLVDDILKSQGAALHETLGI